MPIVFLNMIPSSFFISSLRSHTYSFVVLTVIVTNFWSHLLDFLNLKAQLWVYQDDTSLDSLHLLFFFPVFSDFERIKWSLRKKLGKWLWFKWLTSKLTSETITTKRSDQKIRWFVPGTRKPTIFRWLFHLDDSFPWEMVGNPHFHPFI